MNDREEAAEAVIADFDPSGNWECDISDEYHDHKAICTCTFKDIFLAGCEYEAKKAEALVEALERIESHNRSDGTAASGWAKQALQAYKGGESE